MLVDYLNGSPPALPKEPDISPKEHRGTQPRKPHICPPFAPCFQMFLYFCPLWVSQNTEETLDHLKRYFTFAPFQPISAPFAPVRSAPIVQGCPDGCRCSRCCSPSGTEAHKTSQQEKESGAKKGSGKRKNRGKPTNPQRKGYPPPYGRAQAALPLITNSRQKISKKSLGVDLKKFSEKFFVGMFRG